MKYSSTLTIREIITSARFLPGIACLLSLLCGITGFLTLIMNSFEFTCIPSLVLLVFSLILLMIYIRRTEDKIPHGIFVLFAASVASIAIISYFPEYWQGLKINGIIHRSLFSGLLLSLTSLWTICYAIYYLLGATPQAFDLSRYPLILVPVFLGFLGFALIIVRLFIEGVPNLDLEILTTPYKWQMWDKMVYENGWPVLKEHVIRQAGMLNHILGTFLLIVLTSIIALPLGVGAGIYLSEYNSFSRAGIARIIRFAIPSMRAISVLILGITAFSIVAYTNDTALADIFCGYYNDVNGIKHTAHGSYITAAILLSFLVIPVIARATEEGSLSLPGEYREGSLALGAKDGFTLTRLILPWCLPNIITGLVLGCAEIAGSVAVIMLLAGTGEYGVGPLQEVTSLAYYIFDARYGIKVVRDLASPYQLSAAVLLLILTMGLSIIALILKKKFMSRYRSA